MFLLPIYISFILHVSMFKVFIQVNINYTDKVKHRFLNPQHIGSFSECEDIGIGTVGSLACGDIIKLFVKIKDNIIIDAKILVFGCVSAFASAEYMIEILKGKTIEKALQITNNEIALYLELPPIKKHCSVLAQEAIVSAINNYLQKHTYTEKQTQVSNIAQYNINKLKSTINAHNTQTEVSISVSEYAEQKFKQYFSQHTDKVLFVYLIKEKCGYTVNYKITHFNNNQKTRMKYIHFDTYTIAILKVQCKYFSNLYIDIIHDKLDSMLKFTMRNITQYCTCGLKFQIYN